MLRHFFKTNPNVFTLSEHKSYFLRVVEYTSQVKEMFSFSGKCLYASKFQDRLNVSETKEFCAFRGGLIVPIKSVGLFNFLKAHATWNKMDDFHIGTILCIDILLKLI